MKRVILSILAALSLLAPSAVFAQAATSKVVGTCGTQTYVAGKMQYPTMDTTGNACSSGSGAGGSASYTAASAPFSVSAGVNKPAGIDTANSAQFTELCKPGTTTCVDPTAPSGILGVNGTTIATNANPVPTNVAQVAGAAPSLTNPIWIANAEAADTSGTFTNGTQTGSVTNSGADGYAAALLSINGTYATASGVFEASDDAGVTFYSLSCARSDGTGTETGYTTLTNTNRQWSCPVNGNDSVRIRSTAVASGTVNARVGVTAPPPPAGALGVTVTTDKSGTVASGGVAQTPIATNAARKVYCVQNPSATASGVAAESLWVRVNGTAAANVGVELANGAQACESGPTIDQSAVSVFAATTGHKFNAFEKQ